MAPTVAPGPRSANERSASTPAAHGESPGGASPKTTPRRPTASKRVATSSMPAPPSISTNGQSAPMIIAPSTRRAARQSAIACGANISSNTVAPPMPPPHVESHHNRLAEMDCHSSPRNGHIHASTSTGTRTRTFPIRSFMASGASVRTIMRSMHCALAMRSIVRTSTGRPPNSLSKWRGTPVPPNCESATMSPTIERA